MTGNSDYIDNMHYPRVTMPFAWWVAAVAAPEEGTHVRRTLAAAATLALLTAASPPAPAAAAPAAGDPLRVWTATVTAGQVPLLARAGADTTEIGAVPARGRASVEVLLTAAQAARVRADGITLTAHATPRTAPAAAGVFRPYGGESGIAAELREIARLNPGIAKVESIGRTVRGQEILALKVTRDAGKVADGSRPAAFYLGAQHAREWITPEMVRRLAHHFVDGYGTDAATTRLVDTTELWFLPVANPDGYDYTFSDAPGARLWRKNLRDNDGDGSIGTGDGVDLNRNLAFRWGYDDEGSSPDPAAETYRGPAAESEPESRALNAFERRVRPDIAVNFHAVSQALLYGVGWQTATPSPDDVLYRALAGDAAHPAVPGNASELSADLYSTNGDANGEAVNVNGVPMVADEMASCRTAAASDPGDAWEPAACGSSFEFPDDEALIEAEFQRNLPFALAVAGSAADPAQPVVTTGTAAAPFTPHAFAVSYAGTAPQTVAAVIRKDIGAKTLHYRVSGGRERTAPVTAWRGGLRYGGTDNLHYDEYRGEVRGAEPGDTVEVWFTGGGESSSRFSYEVASAPASDTLILADGADPAAYTDALDAAVWDVSEQGTPDALGVLGHYAGVVWAVGEHTAAAATTLAVRDYLNEGGRLVKTGAGAANAEPLSATGAGADDFAQYWLGVEAPSPAAVPADFEGTGALAGAGGPVTGPASTFATFAGSSTAGSYPGVAGPYEPFAGAGMAALPHADDAYARLSRTVDLTGATTAELSLALSYDTEEGWDSVIFEAHTVGSDDWVTLPDAGGATRETIPDNCAALVAEHPLLGHYLTPSGGTCTPAGPWHRLTGAGGGWHPIRLDLSAYAGKRVEVAVTYVSDDGYGGHGAFADDATVRVDGAVTSTDGFETDLAPWTAPADAPGWTRSGTVLAEYAAVAAPSAVTLGFDLASFPAERRTELLRTALRLR